MSDLISETCNFHFIIAAMHLVAEYVQDGFICNFFHLKFLSMVARTSCHSNCKPAKLLEPENMFGQNPIAQRQHALVSFGKDCSFSSLTATQYAFARQTCRLLKRKTAKRRRRLFFHSPLILVTACKSYC